MILAPLGEAANHLKILAMISRTLVPSRSPGPDAGGSYGNGPL